MYHVHFTTRTLIFAIIFIMYALILHHLYVLIAEVYNSIMNSSAFVTEPFIELLGDYIMSNTWGLAAF